MSRINSYLTFDGNCRVAMTFYKECFGGELFFQTVGESPMANEMGEEMKNCILHSSLHNGGMKLMASDMTPETGISHGNVLSLFLDCTSEVEIEEYYEKLSRGGKKEFPLEKTFWGALFGVITDKFGFHWMLNYDEE
jgi:PhnB protein